MCACTLRERAPSRGPSFLFFPDESVQLHGPSAVSGMPEDEQDEQDEGPVFIECRLRSWHPKIYN